MKILNFALILVSSFCMMNFSVSGKNVYQVITSHPHDLEELEGHISTVYQNGRLWVVEVKENAPKEIFTHLRTLSGGERSYMHEEEWITNKSKKVESITIREIVEKVDIENIRKDVEKLSSYRTRAAGTSGNKQAVQDLKKRFQQMKFSVEEICYDNKNCSLIAEKKGSTKPEKVVMTMAHVDSVGKDFAGADDNGSGVAVLLEMARVTQNYSNKKTIRFFISNGEENGLLGSTHYARFLERNDKLSELDLVINMDMVGYNSNGVVELETDPKLRDLAEWFSGLAGKYTDLKTKITLGAWGSDHVPFIKRGAPGILTIEDWSTKTPCYHLECDTPDTLNYDYATSIGKLNVSALLHKDIE